MCVDMLFVACNDTTVGSPGRRFCADILFEAGKPFVLGKTENDQYDYESYDYDDYDYDYEDGSGDEGSGDEDGEDDEGDGEDDEGDGDNELKRF